MNKDKIIKLIMKIVPKLVKTTVAAIIIKNNKILLEKRSTFVENKKWCLPGGHMEFGETAEDTLKRELKEELGVIVKKPKFLGYFDEIIPEIKNHSTVLVFRADIQGTMKIDKSESYEARWFNKKEALKLNLAFKHKDIIIKFLR